MMMPYNDEGFEGFEIDGGHFAAELSKPPLPPLLTFRQLQIEQKEWADKNFPESQNGSTYYRSLMGIFEEAGELAHAFLKQEQNIRGSWDEHEAKAKDAIGDMLVFMANLCSVRGWDMQQIIEIVWGEVRMRDWNTDRLTGGAK